MGHGQGVDDRFFHLLDDVLQAADIYRRLISNKATVHRRDFFKILTSETNRNVLRGYHLQGDHILVLVKY